MDAKRKIRVIAIVGPTASGKTELAVELAPRGIRANSLSPAMVKTPMTAAFFADARAVEADSKKYLLGGGDVKSVANAAQFLLSDASAWITGVNLPVDGGYSCWK